MITLKVRPLTPDAYTRMPGKGVEHSPFRANWSNTLHLLNKELTQLGATNIIHMLDVTEPDIRLDGHIRSTARPPSPTALAFNTRRQGPLMFACNRFNTWHDNTRAIALGLEALRKVDRYGITQSDTQYIGFQALPPAPHQPDWIITLATHSGWTPHRVQANPEAAYRQAVKNTHPDNGGTPETFQQVRNARQP